LQLYSFKIADKTAVHNFEKWFVNSIVDFFTVGLAIRCGCDLKELFRSHQLGTLLNHDQNKVLVMCSGLRCCEGKIILI